MANLTVSCRVAPQAISLMSSATSLFSHTAGSLYQELKVFNPSPGRYPKPRGRKLGSCIVVVHPTKYGYEQQR